jgi:hypothetical protein
MSARPCRPSPERPRLFWSRGDKDAGQAGHPEDDRRRDLPSIRRHHRSLRAARRIGTSEGRRRSLLCNDSINTRLPTAICPPARREGRDQSALSRRKNRRRLAGTTPAGDVRVDHPADVVDRHSARQAALEGADRLLICGVDLPGMPRKQPMIVHRHLVPALWTHACDRTLLLGRSHMGDV